MCLGLILNRDSVLKMVTQHFQILNYPACSQYECRATLDEISSWIENTMDHYRAMPIKSLKSAVAQTLWDHQAFYRKKGLKNGKTCGFWYVNSSRWFSSQRSKKSKKITHKNRQLK